MTKVYQWRFVVGDCSYSWHTVDEDHFQHLLDNKFFGKGVTDTSLFEGRILTVDSIEMI